MPEPKGLAAFFHPKKRRLAYLELTMRKSGGHISRRRWIIEPNRTVKVGRLATSDVMMPADNQISRNHCEVFYNEPKREFIVRDLSKYGTYLADGKPMEKEKSYDAAQPVAVAFPRRVSNALLPFPVRLLFDYGELMLQTNQVAQPLYCQPREEKIPEFSCTMPAGSACRFVGHSWCGYLSSSAGYLRFSALG